MTTYVADTHALIWYFFNPSRLGPDAQVALGEVADGQATLVIPAVVVAEMVMVVEKGRVQATLANLQSIIDRLRRNPACALPSLTSEDILNSASLTAIPDIFDRLIVYEARKHNASLLTRDAVLTRSGLTNVVW
jgi:PIN domain nuclease of toxin-antitoxin system